MFLVNDAMIDLSIGTAGLTALLGYAVVFFGLVLLMLVIILVGKLMVSSRARKEKNKAQENTPNPAAQEQAEYAPGSAGKLALHDVEPKTAALLMAIVADKMGKPINELQFKSIREVK